MLEKFLNERDPVKSKASKNDLEKILNKDENTLFKSEKRVKSVTKKPIYELKVYVKDEYIVFKEETYIKLEKINGFKFGKDYLVIFLDGLQREIDLKKEDMDLFVKY